MRIIAGSRKGARIFAPKGAETRPTGDRVREAAFNLVGPVDGATVLDVYAGSGAMGLEALVATTDGFELAEKDLEIRGEGQLLGTRQAGLSDLKFTRLRADRPLLELARSEARRLVDVPGPLADEVEARLGDRELAA